MADSARDEIGRALEGKLTPEQLKFLMDEVLAIRKQAHGEFTCKACHQKQKHLVEIPDARAVTSALTDLMTQSWGRPTEQKQDTEIIVNRTIRFVCEHGHECAECSASGGVDGDDGDGVPAE